METIIHTNNTAENNGRLSAEKVEDELEYVTHRRI